MAIIADPLSKAKTFITCIDTLYTLPDKDPAKKKLEQKCAELFSEKVSGSYIKTGMRAPLLFPQKDDVMQRCPLLTAPPKPVPEETEFNYATNHLGLAVPNTVYCTRVVELGRSVFNETTQLTWDVKGINHIQVTHEKVNKRKSSN